MDAYSIQADVKAALGSYLMPETKSESNSVMWAMCKKIDFDAKNESRRLVKEAIKDIETKSKQSKEVIIIDRMTDEERKEALEKKLEALILDPKSTAADVKEIRDYFGLGGKKSDVFINVIDYKDAFPEEVDRIACVAEMIKRRIEEVNQGDW